MIVIECSKCNVSFRLLEGKCPNCPYKISPQYVLFMKNKHEAKKDQQDY